MKSDIFKIIMAITLLSFVSCTKEEVLNKQTDKVYRSFLSTDFDKDYFPDGELESNMQAFFDSINEYQNNSNFVGSDYGFSEGVWYLLSAINYTSADAFAQLIEFQEYTYELDIDLSPADPEKLSGASLISAYLNLYENVDALSQEGHTIGAIGLESFNLGENTVEITVKVLVGENTIYEDVDLDNEPTGLPENAQLMMGTDGIVYKSAVKESVMRYNPYLFKSKMSNITHHKKYYVISNVQNNSFYGWTDSDNCWSAWPNGDYILYVWSSQLAYLSAIVSGTRFNTYLSRFFQKKVSGMITQNQSSFYSSKYLFLVGAVNFIPNCPGTGYFDTNAKSTATYIPYWGKVTQISGNLNTYNL